MIDCSYICRGKYETIIGKHKKIQRGGGSPPFPHPTPLVFSHVCYDFPTFSDEKYEQFRQINRKLNIFVNLNLGLLTCMFPQTVRCARVDVQSCLWGRNPKKLHAYVYSPHRFRSAKDFFSTTGMFQTQCSKLMCPFLCLITLKF